METLSQNTVNATQQGLSERLRVSVASLWEQQLHHPFVVALGDGSLARDKFEFYIRQDALFLDVLTKTFGYAVTKTNNHEEMEQFGKMLLDTLLVEKELHRQYGERFGLSASEMQNTPMTPTNYAYTRHLLFIAATGTLPELLTAILPCAWIYAEIGHHLLGNTLPAPEHPYMDWLATYNSPNFDAVGMWIREHLDMHTTSITLQQETRLHEIFLTSTRYEWLFWDMAWRLEEWPI